MTNNIVTPQAVESIEIWKTGLLEAKPTALEETLKLDISRESIAIAYDAYVKSGHRIGIDIEHNASNESLPVEKRGVSGTCVLQLADNGNTMAATDFRWNTQAIADSVSRGDFPYISPEFSCEYRFVSNDGGTFRKVLFLELHRISLTSNPATFGARPIIKLGQQARNHLFGLPKKTVRLSRQSNGLKFGKGRNMDTDILAQLIANAQAQVGLLKQIANSSEQPGQPIPDETLAENPSCDPNVTKVESSEDSAPKAEDAEKVDSEDEKKLSVLRKQFSGKSASDIEAELFTLRLAANGAAIKFSIQAKTEENVESAIQKGLFSKTDKTAISGFKSLSVAAQDRVLFSVSAIPVETKQSEVVVPTKTEINSMLGKQNSIHTVKCSIAKKGDK
jgi:hypothetical protein